MPIVDFKNEIIAKIKLILSQRESEPVKPSIGLALSGGIDSMVLLDILVSKELQPFYQRLFAFHFNHGLRGNESDEDELFLQRYCKLHQINFYSEKIPVLEFADMYDCGIEETARKLRYKHLSEQKNTNNLDYIFLGHHADDKVETVLFNIIRGSGLKGVAALKEINGFYIRPLLNISKSQIINYANANKITFRQDLTNLENDYSRNQIRNILIPQIEKVLNRNIRTPLMRFSEIVAEADDFIKVTAQKLFQNNSKILIDSDFIAIKSSILLVEHSCVAKELLNLLTEKLGAVYHLNYQTSQLIYSKILDKIDFRETNNNLEITLWQGNLVFFKQNRSSIASQTIVLNQYYQIGFFNLFLTENKSSLNQQYFSEKAIKGSIIVKPLDFSAEFYYFGRNKPVPINKVLSDRKIPTFLRNNLFMLTDDEKIIYISGVGIDNRARLTNLDEKAIYLELSSSLLDFYRENG